MNTIKSELPDYKNKVIIQLANYGVWGYNQNNFDDKGNSQVEMLNELVFTEENGKTKMIMHITEAKTLPGVIPLQGLEFAWNQSFDKLINTLNV